MNKLAGSSGCGFKVSNKQDPCTVGVDLASNIISLKSFCAVENSGPQPPRCVRNAHVILPRKYSSRALCLTRIPQIPLWSIVAVK